MTDSRDFAECPCLTFSVSTVRFIKPQGHSAKSREWETPAKNLQSSVAILSSEIPLFSDLSEFVGSCREFVGTCRDFSGLVGTCRELWGMWILWNLTLRESQLWSIKFRPNSLFPRFCGVSQYWKTSPARHDPYWSARAQTGQRRGAAWM